MRPASFTPQPFWQSRYLALAGLVVLLALCFQGLTLRSGHNFDGDFALYVMQAKNLADHTPYESTNYIANPRNAINPALYPPGLPLLLAPVYAFAGLDLDLMKWVGVVALAAWMLVFALIARRYVAAPLALAATALMGFHPYFWDLKDAIFSEFPFAFFCYAALLCADSAIEPDSTASRRWLAAAGIALFVASAYLTRTVGIVLFPAILAASLWRARGLQLAPWAALCGAAALIALVGAQLPSDAGTYVGYFDQFTLAGVAQAVSDYARSLYRLLQLQGPFLRKRELAVLFCFLAIAVVGLVARLRESVSVYEFFVAGFCALLLLFPIRLEPARYSMPLWPLFLLYGLKGASVLGAFLLGQERRLLLPAAVVAAFTASFGLAYAGRDFGRIEDAATDPIAVELYGALKELVPEDGVVLARKPTVIGLFAERRSAIWPEDFVGDADLVDYAKAVGARHLVQDFNQFGGDFDADDRLDEYVRTNRASLKLVFSNEWFNVFELPPT